MSSYPHDEMVLMVSTCAAPTDVQFQTVVVGATIGQACLLLAAGKKGRWFMMPHAKGLKPFFLNGTTSPAIFHWS